MLRFTYFIRLCIGTLLVSCAHLTLYGQDDLDVISGKSQWLHFTDSRNALYHHFAGAAYTLLDQRKKQVAAINSLDEWSAHQQRIKKTLFDIVGPFPEKTPLNAKVLRTVEKDTYTVEHIVYESQPRFYVTSSLFIPKGLKKKVKAPVIIYCSGHSEEGYRGQVYQHVILNLVKKGFVVFAFDPVGQGERLEYYDSATGKSSVGGPTTEHSYPGTQAFITGSSQARYMIWDGIRAVDYLLTRKEIDPARIGITGRSGGGTQSSYIAAFDERITAAAPECYITNFTRLFQSIGPQDAEQNFPSGVSTGLDHGDLLLVRAPKPALMITTTRDIFNIEGARETASEVSRIYKAYGKVENFAMVEDDAPHASTKKNREAMYAFFRKHLSNPGDAVDEEIAILTKDEIRVTPTGQVSTSLGGETVFTLNRKEAETRMADIVKSRTALPGHLRSVSSAAKTMSGYEEPGVHERPIFTGRIQRTGYAIEKYFIKGEGDYVIPYLRIIPDQKNKKAILYLHPGGKSAEAGTNGEIESLAKQGFEIWAPDLPGHGELGGGNFRGDAFIGGVSHNTWYAGMLLGRSIVGVQASDITRLIDAIKDQSGAVELYGIARRELAPAMLHAAVFNTKLTGIALIEPLISYRSLVTSRAYHSPFILGAVPGQLKAYDLPDLAAAIAPRDLMIVDPQNANGEKDETPAMADDLAFIRKAFQQNNASGRLYISPEPDGKNLADKLSQWQR